MHPLAALLAAEHLNDLLREAATERRARLVRGSQRSAWSAIAGRLGVLLSRLTGRRWTPPIQRVAGPHAAEA